MGRQACRTSRSAGQTAPGARPARKMHPRGHMTRLRRMGRIRRRREEDPTAWKTRRYERTRRRGTAGALPRVGGYQTWSWVVTGLPCDGCGEPAGAAEVQHDVDGNRRVVWRLHSEWF